MIEKIGYIEVVFTEEIKKAIMQWSSSVKETDLYVIISPAGKVEGGNMTGSLHLTLFFGIGDACVNHEAISKHINSIDLKELRVKGLGTFPVPNYNCKVLFLGIDVGGGELFKIHENFKKFSYFKKYQHTRYALHISIAYINNDFELNNLTYAGPILLPISEIRYRIKNIYGNSVI